MPPRSAFLCALFLAGLALRSVRIAAPFHALGEMEGAVYGQEFRNLHRYGIEATRGWPCDVLGRWSPGEPLEFHASHGPLPNALNVLFQKTVGVGADLMPEWSIRTLSILCGALVPLALFGIVDRLAGRPKARLSGAIAAVLPGPVFFSQAVSAQMPLTLLLCLLAVLAYLRWAESPGPGRMALLLAALVASWLCLWEAYYLVPTLAVFHLATRTGRRAGFPILLGALALGVGGGILLYTRSLPGALGLIERAADRSSLPPLAGYAGKTLIRAALYNTAAGLLFLGAWLWTGGLARWRSPWHLWIGLCLAWGLYDLLLLPDYAFHHAYAVLPLSLAVSCASAEVFVGLRTSRRALAWTGLALLLIQSAFVIHRRYRQNEAYPLTQELARSVKGRLSWGEDLLVGFTVEEPFVGFYADAGVACGIHSPADLERAKREHPHRHFRLLAETTPEAMAQLPFAQGPLPGASMGLGLPAAFRERPVHPGRDEMLKAFGVLPGDAGFRQWLDARYARFGDGPFLYYDLDRPLR